MNSQSRERCSRPLLPLALRVALAAAMVVVAAAVVARQPLRGAILVTVTHDNGIDSGDLLVLPLLAAAFSLAAGWPRRLVRRSTNACPLPSDRAETPLSDALFVVPFGLSLLALGVLRVPEVARNQNPNLALLSATALLAGGIVIAAAIVGPSGRRALLRRSPRSLAVLLPLVAGYLVDTALMPSGTVVGPFSLVLLMAATRRPGAGTAHWWVLAAALGAVNVIALVDIAGLDVAMAANGGGQTRTIALGAVLAIGGLGDHLAARRRNAAAADARRLPVG